MYGYIKDMQKTKRTKTSLANIQLTFKNKILQNNLPSFHFFSFDY